MQALRELSDTNRRLVNKLVVSLHQDVLDDTAKKSINRVINRSRRTEDDSRGRPNGYLLYYKTRYKDLAAKGKSLTEIGSIVGGEWRSKSDDEKQVFNSRAQALDA
jgi:hypothetical protein